jgi:hypothetical protein
VVAWREATAARADDAEARAGALAARADAAREQRACVVCFEQPKSHAPEACLHLPRRRLLLSG